jgi:transcription elongation factor GreA
MAPKTHEMSQATYDRLVEEYTDLTTRGRIDIARKIEVAREMGDLKENGDYHAAKDEQGKMEARAGHLGALIESAVILESTDSDEVINGSVVTIVYEGDDEEEKFLLGLIEEKRLGTEVISPTSPLGKVLLGAKVGETVTYSAPSGELRVTVRAIE